MVGLHGYNYMEGNFTKAHDLLLKLLEVISLHAYFVCHNQLAEISKSLIWQLATQYSNYSRRIFSDHFHSNSRIPEYIYALSRAAEYCMLANCKEGSSYVHKHYAIFAVNMFFLY